MRLLFAGTPEFAAVQLRALVTAGHEVVLVLTQPDRPSGRGLRLQTSAVKRVAEEAGLQLAQPASLKDPEIQKALCRLEVEAWVVAAYGLILPAAILQAPRFGCINVHASLLPRWRGAAPIQRAIMAGDRETGVSIMQMDQGLDTGPVYLQLTVSISDTDTGGSLHDRLAELGTGALLEVLHRLPRGDIHALAQPAAGIEYAAKLRREDLCIDWTKTADSVARMIRALDPAPGAFSLYRGQAVKIWRAQVQYGWRAEPPGTVLEVDARGLIIACGQGTLLVSELQRAGGKRMLANEFARGFAVRAGERFASEVAAI